MARSKDDAARKRRGGKPSAAAAGTVGRAERRQRGKALRERCPRSTLGVWKAPARGRDVVRLVEQSNDDRVPELVPVRHGRMLQSPFAFYRGSAFLQAYDLARSPVSGIPVQLCGDAHLMNFGGFATPERQLIFDLNDFDETLPGPFEYDLKRMAASFTIAARTTASARPTPKR